MNNAKKIMKNQGNENAKKKTSSLNKTKILIGGGIAICVLIIAALCYEQFRPRVIATVGTEKIYLTDAMYDIYSTETQYNSMSSIYKQIYGSDYWSMEVDDEGTTGAKSEKDKIMQKLQQRSVLCQEAKKYGVFLTEEEKKKAVENISSITEGMTAKQKGMMGLSESKIKEVLEEQALADKYKQQLIAGYEIDDAAITKTVSKKENRGYNLQYYYASTQTTDANNNTVAKSEEEKATLKSQMEAHLAQAKTAKDFSKLLGKDENSGIQYLTKELVEKDTDFLTEDLRKQLKKMKNGELSDLIETEDGYYFFRMENNNSKNAYDTAVKEAISKEEEEQFELDYKSIASSYEIEVNKGQWDKIKLGSYTTTPSTTTTK